jgi:transposase
MKHIGLDVHSTTTVVNVLNDRGRSVLRREIPTREAHLVDLMQSIAGPKRAALEESQMADFIARVIAPYVTEVIRCQPQHNRLISGSENKCDAKDAEKLAELLYLNKLKSVHHPTWEYRELRQGVRCYWKASQDLTRAKNRLKAFYLFNGLHCDGEKTYSNRQRGSYQKELKSRSGNLRLLNLQYRLLDFCRESKAAHVQELHALTAELQEDVARLVSIPGIGFIGACTLVAYLENGWRIPNKRKLWKYCGLSLRTRESNHKGYKGASRTGNRHVKNVLMTAVSSLAARRKATNALSQAWQAGRAAGIEPDRLRRNLARTIVVLAHHLLRFKEQYCDDRVMTRH